MLETENTTVTSELCRKVPVKPNNSCDSDSWTAAVIFSFRFLNNVAREHLLMLLMESNKKNENPVESHRNQ